MQNALQLGGLIYSHGLSPRPRGWAASSDSRQDVL